MLRQLVQVAGLQDITIWRTRHHEWHLNVTVTQRFTRVLSEHVPRQRIRTTRQVTLVLL